jgi:hypothetical protein
MLKPFKLLIAIITLSFIQPTYASLFDELAVQQPTVGPVLGKPDDDNLRVWLCGPILEQPDNQHHYGVVQIKPSNTPDWLARPFVFPLQVYYDVDGFKHPKDYVGFVDIPVVPGQYEYRAGYISSPHAELPILTKYSWNLQTYTVNLRDPLTTEASLVFGSCRYFAKLTLPFLPKCFTIYPWLQKSDQVFASIANQASTTDGIACIGDQIYADYFNFLAQSSTYEEFLDLYVHAFTTPNLRRVLATIPNFFILDDHEVSNNFGAAYEVTHANIFRAGMASYMTFQHMVTPGFKNEPTLFHEGYPMKIGKVPAFMLNARSNRTLDPVRIISANEMETVKNWLTYWNTGANKSTYKVLFSSVPMFPIYANNPGQDDDKWWAAKEQMMELLQYIDNNRISGIIICAGDIHKSLYAQINTPAGVTITTVIASPFHSPWGHDEGPNSELQTERLMDPGHVNEFVPGYPFVSASIVYHTDAYARLAFPDSGKLKVQLLDRNGGWLNEHDHAGYEFDLNPPADIN